MNLHVQLFNIEQCGFYKGGERKFGAMREWYRDFLRWVDLVSDYRNDYSLTYTFDRRTKIPSSIFCTRAVEDGDGNFGVMLWNEGHRNDRGIMYIPRTGPVGTVSAGTVPLPNDGRPGWPSYFWVVPNEEIVIAIMPNSKITSIESFRDYFKEYLRRESEYCVPYSVHDPQTGETVIKHRYKAYGDHAPTPGAFPKLTTNQSIIYYRIDDILNRWQEINRFVLHSERMFLQPELSSVPKRFIERLLFQQQEQPVQLQPVETVMRVEMNWEPQSQEEVKEVIDEWLSEAQGEQNWAGVKFSDPDDNSQHLFDRAKSIGSVSIESDLELGPGLETWDDDQFRKVWEQSKTVVQQLHQQARR